MGCQHSGILLGTPQQSDIANALGPRALQVLDQLIEIGLLLPPDHSVQEVMFSNLQGFLSIGACCQIRFASMPIDGQ